MNLEQAAFYQRLQVFSLDHPDAHLSFSRRLARDNNWSLPYANRVIEEYKKFAFLAVVAGHPVTPSDQVDQVWHLHLLYTHSYWEVFCPQVLQTPLHHGPTQGGNQERHKFTNWYEQTLASYNQFFGAPPADIWSPSHIRFSREIHFVRVNTHQNWIIPKVKFSDWGNWIDWLPLRWSWLFLLVVGLLLGLPGCGIQTIPIKSDLFTEPLSEFAVSYMLIGLSGFIGAIVIAAIGRLFNRNRQLAPILLALLTLLLFGLTLFRVAADVTQPTGIEFLGFYALAFLSGPPFSLTRSSSNLQGTNSPFSNTQIENWNELIRVVAVLGLTSLCSLGIARIFIGLSRERPVGYLTVLCVILGFYTLRTIEQELEADHGLSILITNLCKILLFLSLIITVPGSIYFLWIKLGGSLIWLGFIAFFGYAMIAGKSSNYASRSYSSSNYSTSSSNYSGRTGRSYTIGGNSDGGDGGGSDGGDSGCGGCGGCGD
jgi:hypothetical protein